MVWRSWGLFIIIDAGADIAGVAVFFPEPMAKRSEEAEECDEGKNNPWKVELGVCEWNHDGEVDSSIDEKRQPEAVEFALRRAAGGAQRQLAGSSVFR